MGKIKQFSTILICKCVGRPAAANIEGRIKCEKIIQIPVNEEGDGPMATSSFRLIQKETQPFLEKAGWMKLKTLGYFQRLCPSCSKHVLAKRALDKETWG